MARKKKTVELDRANDIAPGLVAKTKKRLVIARGSSHPELAAQVAEQLSTELVPTEYRTFASGEILTRFEVSIRGCDLFLIQSFGPPVNEWMMETLIMLDAAKRASAKRITVVAPYFPYSRQDKKGRGREPISARLVADLFKTAGADRIMSVDLHAAQIQGFFDGPVDHLFAKPVLLEYFEKTLSEADRERLTVVSPDTGRVRVADQWSDSLGAPLAIIHKRRDPNVANQVTVNEIVGEVNGRNAGHRRRDARDLQRSGGRAAAEPGDRRGGRDRHGADPRREALPEPYDSAYRTAARTGDPRSVRGRLRHQHVRRGGLTPAPGLTTESGAATEGRSIHDAAAGLRAAPLRTVDGGPPHRRPSLGSACRAGAGTSRG
jgi:ribose-phosphate pyrophosphokinase